MPLLLHLLIDFMLFNLGDAGILHEFLLVPEIQLILIETTIHGPEQTSNFCRSQRFLMQTLLKLLL